MKRLAFLLLLAIGLNASAAKKPNVLFISIDDLNDWVGKLGGHPQGSTPNIDALAERGVLFANTHCAAPACNPSRAALMTGVTPDKSGVYVNPQPWRPALPDAVTIPQYFMKHGYTAKASGKIFHGRYPDPASWQTYVPDQKQNKFSDPNPQKKNNNGLKKGHFDWAPLPNKDSEMGDYQTVDWISKQLAKKQKKPFFLACGLYRPHLPWFVPQKYFDQFPLESIQLPKIQENDLSDLPAAARKMANPGGDHAAVTKAGEWKKAVQGYLASVAFVDAQIGRLMKAFDASPNRDNTIIVLWTDHGWHLGEKSHWRKFALWRDATRTPMIWVVPEGISKSLPSGSATNRISHQPTSLMDIYPTLIDLCGLPSRSEIAGKSLMPLIENPQVHWQRAVVTIHGRNNYSVQDHHWRYIRYADGSEELYDQRKDPNEWNNLGHVLKHRSEINRLAKWIPGLSAEDAAYDKGKAPKKAKKKK